MFTINSFLLILLLQVTMQKEYLLSVNMRLNENRSVSQKGGSFSMKITQSNLLHSNHVNSESVYNFQNATLNEKF